MLEEASGALPRPARGHIVVGGGAFRSLGYLYGAGVTPDAAGRQLEEFYRILRRNLR